jgi:hypothetical protein
MINLLRWITCICRELAQWFHLYSYSIFDILMISELNMYETYAYQESVYAYELDIIVPFEGLAYQPKKYCILIL